MSESIIDNKKIFSELEQPPMNDAVKVREVLAKARELKGLDYHDALTLLRVEEPALEEELFDTARFVKEEIYGNRLVFFAPLYISNLCKNVCTYCAFRGDNKLIARKALTQDEIRRETEILIAQGHKRLLVVSGEAYPQEGLRYVYNALETIYSVRTDKGNIRRCNVNLAPLSVDEFKELKKAKIGTYQIFQETFHEPSYRDYHIKGPKADYQYRLETVDRAFEAGIDDVGVGILFGLYDWKYEVLALLSQIQHLEKKFGMGPHTISVPRIEPATGADVSESPPFAVSDRDFKKIIAVFRMAVPYTGMILSTRENPQMRRDALAMGISQISAGSRTDPGGYTDSLVETSENGQFSLGDTRPLQEVIKDVVSHGYLPSFCTGCYRLGRVGKDFMDLAKPGLIKKHCLPNAIFTFSEYLKDFAGSELRQQGMEFIHRIIQDSSMSEEVRSRILTRLPRIEQGERDVYV